MYNQKFFNNEQTNKQTTTATATTNKNQQQQQRTDRNPGKQNRETDAKTENQTHMRTDDR